QRTGEDAQRQHHPRDAPPPAEREHGAGDQQEDQQHPRDQPLVFLALHLERLEDLASPGLLLGLLGRLLRVLVIGWRHKFQDTDSVVGVVCEDRNRWTWRTISIPNSARR